MHMKSRRVPKEIAAFQATTRLTPTKLLAWIGAFIEYYLIIATHFHYTVDVFVAFLLAIIVWKFYHYYILHTSQSSDKVGIERIFNWLEGGAEDLAQLSKDVAVLKGKIGESNFSDSIHMNSINGGDARVSSLNVLYSY